MINLEGTGIMWVLCNIVIIKHNQRIASSMASPFSRGYSDIFTGDYSFVVRDVDGKGGVVPSINHLSSNRYDYCIDGGDFVSTRRREYSSISHP